MAATKTQTSDPRRNKNIEILFRGPIPSYGEVQFLSDVKAAMDKANVKNYPRWRDLENERILANEGGEGLVNELADSKLELAKTEVELAKIKAELAKSGAELAKIKAELAQKKVEWEHRNKKMLGEKNKTLEDVRCQLRQAKEAQDRAKEAQDRAKEAQDRAKEAQDRANEATFHLFRAVLHEPLTIRRQFLDGYVRKRSMGFNKEIIMRGNRADHQGDIMTDLTIYFTGERDDKDTLESLYGLHFDQLSTLCAKYKKDDIRIRGINAVATWEANWFKPDNISTAAEGFLRELQEDLEEEERDGFGITEAMFSLLKAHSEHEDLLGK